MWSISTTSANISFAPFVVHEKKKPVYPVKGEPGGSGGFMVQNSNGGFDRFLDKAHIRRLRDRAANITREAHVRRMLAAAAGVYIDKARGKRMGLETTVFLSVVAYQNNAADSSRSIAHYKSYFRNFACFAVHHNLDFVAYLLHHALANVEAEVLAMEQLGVRALTYPDHLFWSIVLSKPNKVLAGKSFAPYLGDVPSFAGYGALAMLVPQLEALTLGYSVIYFDVDIGLVQDPVPYITRGDADFVVSIEQRKCVEEYPSSRRMAENWEQVEPNTGVMLVRATRQGVQMYRNWLKRIVKTNVQNDQIVFDRDRRRIQVDMALDGSVTYSETNFTSTFTPNCNWHTSNEAPTKRATQDAATYCFLSEMMFQNGLVSFTCSTKMTTRDDWHVEMVRQVPPVQVNGIGPWLRLPVAVHANYCNAKSKELDLRGLWLYVEQNITSAPSLTAADAHASTAAAGAAALSGRRWAGTQSGRLGPGEVGVGCKAYNASNVYYAFKNWTAEIAQIEARREGVLRSVLANGTLLKRYGGKEVYLMLLEPSVATATAANATATSAVTAAAATNTSVSGTRGGEPLATIPGPIRRLIPDSDTFISLGSQWNQVRSIPTAVLNRIHEGPPLPSTSTTPKKKVNERRPNTAFEWFRLQ